ncbi:hypothetical protein QE390_002291 [Siphonobacter sp. SORGH_AS 1065]|nr:hypothetical protein [Siphonobacter sp. SORGH_AS_1065]
MYVVALPLPAFLLAIVVTYMSHFYKLISIIYTDWGRSMLNLNGIISKTVINGLMQCYS